MHTTLAYPPIPKLTPLAIPFPTATRTPPAGLNLVKCLSRRSQQAVWKNNGTGTNTGPLHYVFEPMESGGGNVLHLHRLMTRGGNLEDLEIYDITRDEFRNLSTTYTFTLIGGTSSALMNRFKKREERLERRCKRRGRCSLQMKDMEKKLKIKPPEMRVRCAWGEREF
ncbi:hypothetical protein Pcinc_039995 [Petrolisthes cinctipes]|uniref:Uncharacterized protein n=1 Tax=Petrolisthes cinctipes TaxID=88211 RepID=A0AAE1EIZ2_PETCI|nr:hypothetical protein Pcinc_039995 [Petrolisthes cinctipes]